MLLPNMNSAETAGGGVDNGRKWPSFKERKQVLEEFMKGQITSDIPNDHERKGSVRKRLPLHRSNTEVPQRVGSFRRKILSWFSANDVEDYKAARPPAADWSLREGKPIVNVTTTQNSNEMEVSSGSSISKESIPTKLPPHQFTANHNLLSEKLRDTKIPSEAPTKKFSFVNKPLVSSKPAFLRQSSNMKGSCMTDSNVSYAGTEEYKIELDKGSEYGAYESLPIESAIEVKPISPSLQVPDTRTSEQVIRHILDELIDTEESYVETLSKGLKNYSNIFEREDLPVELEVREYELFANVQDIAEFHRDHLLPMFQENRESAEATFKKFQEFVEKKYFQIYILFTVNKKRSMQLCATHRTYFQKLQTELGDRLGISSFLLQPIQRMARYPLLLTEIIKALYKHKKCPLLTTCCRLEYTVTNLVKTLNASECINDIKGTDITDLFSTFRRFDEFEAYDYILQRRYPCKLFLFDKTIIATEIIGDALEFRLRYAHNHLKVTETKEGFTLDYQGIGWDDCRCDYSAKSMSIVGKWLKLIQEIIPPSTTVVSSDDKMEYSPLNFRRCEVFEVVDHTLGMKYSSKLFQFAKCLVYTEVKGMQTLYRGTYPYDELGILPDLNYFTLFRLRRYRQNCDFRADPVIVKEWMDLLRDLATSNFKRAGSFRRKFSNAVSALNPKLDERTERFN